MSSDEPTTRRPLTLILFRHGQTESNKVRMMRGSSETEEPLTSTGEKQARALGERLRSYKFTEMYSSPMERAKQTARLVLETQDASEVRLTEVEAFGEVNLHDWEGKEFRKSFREDEDIMNDENGEKAKTNAWFSQYFNKGFESSSPSPTAETVIGISSHGLRLEYILKGMRDTMNLECATGISIEQDPILNTAFSVLKTWEEETQPGVWYRKGKIESHADSEHIKPLEGKQEAKSMEPSVKNE